MNTDKDDEQKRRVADRLSLEAKQARLEDKYRTHLEQEQQAAQAVQPEPVPLVAAMQALSELCLEHKLGYTIEYSNSFIVYITNAWYARLGYGMNSQLPAAIWAAIAQVKAAGK